MIYFKDLGRYGRLGNSLFQAAATIALAKRNNDTFGFPASWQYRSAFNIPPNCFLTKLSPSSNYEEPKFAYTEIPYRPGLNIHGYFQSELYFKDFENDIKDILTPRHKSERQSGVASIHVRRTDYLKFPDHHPVLDMDYYESAMDAVGAGKFIVFSDDIQWCKSHFLGNQFEFSEGHAPEVDLSIMLNCDHHIIANSSFSWWGAWLCRNDEKTVVAPNQWFGPALTPTHPTTSLIPEQWVQM